MKDTNAKKKLRLLAVGKRFHDSSTNGYKGILVEC